MNNMPVINLSLDQEDALERMKNGCILHGGTGSGKSRTGIAFYYTRYGGQVNTDKYVYMKNPPDLYIITTARKRDTLEWEKELSYFYLSTNPEVCLYKSLKIVVDSWNNIGKYITVENAFFIFDEQRVIGYGKWTKTFLKIASRNSWILLTATPGDTWHDYIPVFIANGFFRNKTDFEQRHCVWSRFTPYPKVEKYVNEARLLKFRDHITVDLEYKRHTIPHHFDIQCDYDKGNYDFVVHNRWNVFKEKPIENASEYCSVLRQIVNSSVDRQIKLMDIVMDRKKVIIFYTYDYELEILRKLFKDRYPMTEWNGHKHEPLLDTDHWVYLVQYTAGSEAWNCITTDTIVFYSQSYSYKQMVQAAGRIDRRNTPYTDLYYYHLKSGSKIDKAIASTLRRKKTFSEKGFAPDFSNPDEKRAALYRKDILEQHKQTRQLNLFDFDFSEDNSESVQKSKQEDVGKRFPDDYCEIYCNWEDPNNPMYDPDWVKNHKQLSNVEFKKE